MKNVGLCNYHIYNFQIVITTSNIYILEQFVIPALHNYLLAVRDKLIEFQTKLEEHSNRLTYVRQRHVVKLKAIASGMQGADDQDDLHSETQSTVSSSSRGTSRSHK